MRGMIEDRSYHEVRANIATEGAKALLLINGGGIVALLGFLSSVWDEAQPALINGILQGIWLLALALVSAAANFFLRYWASTSFQRGWTRRHQVFRFLEWAVIVLSFLLFLSALSVMLTGAGTAVGTST